MAPQYSILLLDDEPDLLEVTQAMLEALFEEKCGPIYLASNGFEGIETYKKHSIDVTLSDFKMPGMNGVELLQGIQEINPNAAVGIMTGTKRDLLDQYGERLTSTPILEKPYQLQELRAFTQELLDRIER